MISEGEFLKTFQRLFISNLYVLKKQPAMSWPALQGISQDESPRVPKQYIAPWNICIDENLRGL